MARYNYIGYIYIITNDINGKSYIGKTNDLVRRWKEHCYGNSNTSILSKALKKYGLSHFIFDIVAQIPFDDIDELNTVLKELEIYYIALYNTFKDGYNATVGGDGISGYKQSKETTDKIRKANTGRVVSDETKAKISANRKGIGHSEESKQKITKALLNRDYSIYERAAEKRRGVKRDHEIVMKGAVKRRKPILQYDLQGNFVKEWEGASLIDGFESTNIASCCKGKIFRSQGFIWRYKEGDDYPTKIEVPTCRSTMNRAILQCDTSNNIIKEYPSISKAAESIGIKSGNLCKYLKKGGYFNNEYIWKYKERREVMYA